MNDSTIRIEAALRGAKIAQVALQLLESRGDVLTLRLVTRELSEQVLALQNFTDHRAAAERMR